LGRASSGDGALVAVQTAIMPVLQIQGTVSERIATLHTFAATDAQFLIDRVFKIGIFDERPFDRARRTELAFRPGISHSCPWLQISAAQVTVSAHREGMDTFYSGMRQNTVDRTFFTLDTDIGIQLPDHLFRGGLAEQNPSNPPDRETDNSVRASPDEIPSFDRLFQRLIRHRLLHCSSLRIEVENHALSASHQEL
jgi:hypothetical protein